MTDTATATAPGPSSEAKRHVLIGCTGSVASIKVPLLVEQLLKTNKVEVAVVATENALHFFNPTAVLAGEARLYRDTHEWQAWSKIQDPVLHIELRRWADILVIAPLDANTLAKIAGGLCDNLLTCIVRAWDLKRPLLFCPAMNTHMWEHPITAKHIETLLGYGYREVKCVEKTLACGDKGYGAMAEVPTIVNAVLEALEQCPVGTSKGLPDHPGDQAGPSSPKKKMKHSDESTS
ncbi:phosphopantothenoylcysteine decarboxylase-like isoform X1 [Amphiura filiformis]|uniref:phosphopantothenoylcysteine decarboxylase-like isoform X1 n=1 Tax=Amphiura filiformis TaxID=82378 RepID=UPI003B210BF3